MDKIKNRFLFFTLSLSAFVILALASYTLSKPADEPAESRQEK